MKIYKYNGNIKQPKLFAQFFLFVIAVIVIILAIFLASTTSKNEYEDSQDYVWDYDKYENVLEYNSKQYVLNDNIETILVSGVDNIDSRESDAIFLIIANHNKKVVDIVQIDRDTMAEVYVIDKYGRQKGSAYEQIALASTYSDAKSFGCQNTVNTVKKLLFNININDYICISGETIPFITDFVGGVEVKITDDFSNVNTNLIKDKNIVLTGQDAYDFVHERKEMQEPTNTNRMNRQKQYLHSLIQKVGDITKSAKDLDVNSLYNQISDYVTTSMTVLDIQEFFANTYNYQKNEVISLKGEFSDTSILEEFYVDDASLKDLVVNLFYKEKVE